MKLHYGIYFASVASINIIYALLYIGILASVPKYLYILIYGVQLFLCIFLLIRYHPFRNAYSFNQYDAKLIFGAALLILLNLVSIPLVYSYLPKPFIPDN